MWPVDYDDTPLGGEGEGKTARKSDYPPLPLIDGNEKVKEVATHEDQNTLTARYTERAVRFIENNRRDPFFLFLPHSMPHVPLGASEAFRGKSGHGLYGDVILEIDASAGRIMEALREHGLEKDTLVAFASDNGPWRNFGNHAGGCGPLREGKGTSFEGGVRVPCLVEWPGRIPAGVSSGSLASTLDLLPTFAALAGAPLPKNKIDGVDLSPLLSGDESAAPRERMAFYYPEGGKHDQLQAVTDGRFKLHLPHEHRSYEGVEPGMDGMPGPYATGKTDLALFDLDHDIGERIDVKDQHPEVMQALLQYAEEMREELGDHDRPAKGARPPGRVE